MQIFPEDYPSKPPKCSFYPPIYHPNVWSSGDICLSIISEGQGWRPAISIKQIAIGIQDLLVTPNPNSPAVSKVTTHLSILNLESFEEYGRYEGFDKATARI